MFLHSFVSGTIATRQWNTGTGSVVLRDYKPMYPLNCQQDTTSQL